MKLPKLFALAALAGAVTASPTVHPADLNVTIQGLMRNGIEVFLGIPYAEDTSGANRFKPPVPYVPPPGATIDATKAGPACPQMHGMWNAPLTLSNISDTSEDCLNLNIARPSGLGETKKLPVMVWIHGGSFWVGSNTEPTHQPDGLVLESIDSGFPVIHVAMNYRLGFFGFAQSEALEKEKSENAGLRDQRLAIEWVRDHIAEFGGDPNRITIFGQSSGGLAVGMQLLAYGGTKPLPFKQGICESQALEPGITGNFSIDAMTKVVDYVGCNSTSGSVHSPEVITCLRLKDTETLRQAMLETYVGDIAHNIGDIWLPVVDGDFLPAAPSQLIAEGRFGDATYIMGWTQGDVNFFTNISITTARDTFNFIQGYLPEMPADKVWMLLGLYPVSEFTPPPGTNLTAEFYRAARIFRDILMVCEPILLAEGIRAHKDSPVYLYNWNQTILDPILEAVYNVSGMGVVHTSEFAYIYGNLSHYNVSGYPFNPTQEDYDLRDRASASWSVFPWFGSPWLQTGNTTLQGWNKALFQTHNDTAWLGPFPGYTYVMTIGGPREGYFALDGPDSIPEVSEQRLRERCTFINDPNIVQYLQY
ncbi:alpha/beta-hydrolase [Trematosphaeria pertusa]|uniref:Carboxylic ester hydrolase n=1 Tax=Trematosphaeria pertusa TaxID=390896 RepID=A0A6A6IDZ3_9PLEO|nr:alpha/beta-hydrolase [Trematosphaeria pertusa]KAF2248112.1 alpha/beta-hydrolase [Trematosphaeria pertusa]